MSKASTVKQMRATTVRTVMKSSWANPIDRVRSNPMKPRITMLLFLLTIFFSVAGNQTSLSAQQPADQNATAPADNTKVNRQDQNTAAPTADKQKNDRSDRDTTRQIRRAIVNDKSLSTYAHNVKIITQNGQVTLKGPVRSDEEKQAIEEKATAIAGESKVTSELAVKPKS
jgi:hypothetical protein